MWKITKLLIFWVILSLSYFGTSFAKEYIYYYWQWCSHCAKVAEYLESSKIEEKINIQKKEVYFDRNNNTEFLNFTEKNNISAVWVPFLLVKSGVDFEYFMWDVDIIDFFKKEDIEVQKTSLNDDIEYTFFYGNWCPHCLKVEEYFKEKKIYDLFNIESKEIYFNQDNLKDYLEHIDSHGIQESDKWVPFLAIEKLDWCSHLVWDKSIINYFEWRLQDQSIQVCETNTWFDSNNIIQSNDTNTWWLSFFLIMLPAALADSINPCAFAVMLLLLSSILSKSKNKKRALLSWFMFSLSVFLSYLAMGFGLYQALSNVSNIFWLKLIVWILWVVVWLINLKEYFFPWVWFVAEVPMAWRPKMKKIIDKALSPRWAFVIWLIISLFLLPCTSWPYLTVLWYLASESNSLNMWWSIYIIIYNLIFVLPMIIITLIVGLWVKSAEELARIKNKNTWLIHLVVWLLMLLLGIYVLNDVYGFIPFF